MPTMSALKGALKGPCRVFRTAKCHIIASLLLAITLQLVEGSQRAAEWSTGIKGHLSNLFFIFFFSFSVSNCSLYCKEDEGRVGSSPRLVDSVSRAGNKCRYEAPQSQIDLNTVLICTHEAGTSPPCLSCFTRTRAVSRSYI